MPAFGHRGSSGARCVAFRVCKCGDTRWGLSIVWRGSIGGGSLGAWGWGADKKQPQALFVQRTADCSRKRARGPLRLCLQKLRAPPAETIGHGHVTCRKDPCAGLATASRRAS